MPDEPPHAAGGPPQPFDPPSPDARRPPAALPPLLNYPSLAPPPEAGTERWPEMLRAVLIVFGALAFLFFGVFGLCGLLGRGCG